MLQLRPRTPHSFDCTDLPSLATWLEAHGFTPIPHQHTLIEFERFERSQRLIIAYHSGAISVAGKQIAPCIALLNELVPVVQLTEVQP